MKKILLASIFSIIAISMFSYEVDEKEIKREKADTIEFINYSGTHTDVDSVNEIYGIGKSLGVAVKKGSAGNSNKYYVIHAVDQTTTEGFDADIVIIGKNARVDHIDNIRLIIAGYLEAGYGYSTQDAKTIAHFVTIYNAVYRQDMNTFNTRYKKDVTKNLTAEKAGLAVKYTEWPGKSQIVIPLMDPKYAGTLSTVNTTTITEEKVVEKMQEEKDKEIPVREKMIDLKERESQEAEVRAQQAQKDASEKEKEALKKEKIAKDAKQKAKKNQNIAKQKQKEANLAKDTAKKSGKAEDKKLAQKKQQEANVAKKKAEKQSKIAEKKEKEAIVAKKDVKEKQNEAATEQKLADTKDKEAQSDRKNVAADTQKIIEEKSEEKKAKSSAAIASAIPGYGLKVVDKNKLLSELVLLDLKTAKELKTSAVNTIHGRCLLNANGKLMAIAGTDSGDGVISLVLFDPKTLEVIQQGENDIASDSILIQNEKDYYAVVNENGKHYVGRFNADLKLQSKSSIEVLPYTPLTFTEDGVMVQTTGNNIKLLTAKDLIDVIK